MKSSRNISELISLNGRTAIVTGGAGHIGSTIAEAFLELGATVIILDLDEHHICNISTILNKRFPGNCHGIACDLENTNEIECVPERIKKLDDKLDILVNCAALVGTSGLKGWATPLESQSIDTWKRALDVNLTGAFHLIKTCLPLLNISKHASIINIGSIYGFAGMDMSLYEGMNYITPAAYAASKGGLTQLSRYLATALAPKIRVNTISPGGIERGQSGEFQKRYKIKTPLKRMGTEEDLKGSAAFLASDLSSYITGQNIVIDGGWSL